MGNLRIRYYNKDENTLKSVRDYFYNEDYYSVEIDKNNMSYQILKNGIPLTGERGAFLHDVKIKAKSALEKIGITFQEESRNRGTSET